MNDLGSKQAVFEAFFSFLNVTQNKFCRYSQNNLAFYVYINKTGLLLLNEVFPNN